MENEEMRERLEDLKQQVETMKRGLNSLSEEILRCVVDMDGVGDDPSGYINNEWRKQIWPDFYNVDLENRRLKAELETCNTVLANFGDANAERKIWEKRYEEAASDLFAAQRDLDECEVLISEIKFGYDTRIKDMERRAELKHRERLVLQDKIDQLESLRVREDSS
jgi:hypothetical protein